MQNQGLGRQSEKICAKSASKNTTDTPQFIRPIGPISQNIWNVFEKRPYWLSVVRVLNDSISQREKSDASTTARVYMVGTIRDDLLIQRRHKSMGQFRANIILIRTNSKYLWASEVFKNQSFKSQLFSSSQKKISSWNHGLILMLFFINKIKNLCQFSKKNL